MALTLRPGYRIHFGKDGDAITVLLVGDDKGSQARTSRGHEDSGATIWRRKGMARRHEDWNIGLAENLRDPEFAREFLLGAIDEEVPLQVALGKVVRAMGVKEFAAKVGMASPNLLRTLNPRHNPTQDTLNRLLKPFRLKLSLAPISHRPRRRHAA